METCYSCLILSLPGLKRNAGILWHTAEQAGVEVKKQVVGTKDSRHWGGVGAIFLVFSGAGQQAGAEG